MKALNDFFKSKSVIYVENEKEMSMDMFFSKYKEDLTLFKGRLSDLQRVY